MSRIFAIIMVLCLFGCNVKQKTEDLISVGKPAADSATILRTSSEDATKNIKRIVDASGKTVELAVDIRNDAKTIEYDSTVSDALRQSANRIRENADAILSEQKTIQIYSHDILLSLKNHIKLSGDIVALRKELDNLRNANQATRQESLKQLYDYLVWLWGIGFVILICGGFTILYTRKIGGFLIGIGLLTIGFASAAHFYLQQIAIIGLFALIFGILITIGVIVWLIIDANRKEKAVEENVTLIEEVKKDLEPDLKEKIFGDEGIAAEVQSDSTKKIVAKIRSNIESSE